MSKNMLVVLLKEILKGKDLTRTLMNLSLSKYTLSGRVLDIGGGDNPSYFRFFKNGNYELINLDIRKGDNRVEVNFESDRLPYEDKVADKILMLNVLEHIYNYKHLIDEAKRILREDGTIVGFVPFLVGYHPDPSDYFRYTKESLKKIFKETGFKEIKIKEVGIGPFAVSFDSIGFIFPKILRILIYPIYYYLDLIVLKIRPKFKEKFVLGYLFELKK